MIPHLDRPSSISSAMGADCQIRVRSAVVFLGITLLFLDASPTVSLADNTPTTASAAGVQITQLADRLRVEINGRLFTEYYFTNVPRPFYYPLIGPGEASMTRNWPMKSTSDEEHDHRHHRSLWFAHGLINGHDFWSEATNSGRIVHTTFTEIKSGEMEGVIKSQDKWIAPYGTVVCTDERTLRIYNSTSIELGGASKALPAGSPSPPLEERGGERRPFNRGFTNSMAVVYNPDQAEERLFDFEITLHAREADLTLGDTKEGTMAVRVAETMRLKGKVGQGHIVNSAGSRDAVAWGKRADWCDYYGPVDGKTVGIAIFDHPHNPHHPTWWQVRDYGLFAANPFGRHDFERLFSFFKTAGNLKVPAGRNVTFRYRFYLHQGDEQQAKVAKKYQEYTKSVAKP